MNASLWKAVMVGPAALGAALLVNGLPAVAQMTTLDQVKSYTRQGAAQQQAQVTSVSEFSDVKPTDWAFLALQSLVERYGCIAGYPTNPPTFKGNRALTRYEFAAGLNACLDRINELIAAATEPLANKEDLAKVQKLQEQFAVELATLRGRVDSLEARTATLESQQFSTTTKLRGEVIFYPAGVAEADQAQTTIQQARGVPTVQTQDNTIFAYRVRLNFDTSFTGQDRLRTRLQAADTTPFATAVTGTNETRLGFDSDTDGAVQLDKLFYEFPFDNGKGRVAISAVNSEANEFFDTYSGQLESSGNGAISRFGRFNPLMYRIGGAQGAGAGTFITYNFNKIVGIGVGYLALNTNSTGATGASISAANTDQGLFGGNYSVFAQVNVKPVDNFKFGVGYSRSYGTGFDNATGSNGFGVNVTGSTGTSYASDPFGSAKAGDDTPTETNGVNVMFSWTALPQMIISGWFGYTWANALSSSFLASNTVQKNDQAQILTAALQFAFPDPFGRKGDLGGFIVGLPPYVTDNDSGQIVNGQLIKRQNEDVPVHIEGLYRFQVNRNLRITPGFIVIANPQGNADNDTLFVYTVRSTFSF